MTTQDHDLYEDSTHTWAVQVEDEDAPDGSFVPLDLTGATVTAHIDDGNGNQIASWSTTIPIQSGDDLGWVELELAAADRAAILASGKRTLYYDVRMVLLTGEILYPITKSKISVTRAVTA